MNNNKNHITSLRLPVEQYLWIEKYAAQHGIPCSYVYRAAIKHYIQSKEYSNR
jgi:predicted DNA-binding protein